MQGNVVAWKEAVSESMAKETKRKRKRKRKRKSALGFPLTKESIRRTEVRP
jgi:hypothetical protein